MFVWIHTNYSSIVVDLYAKGRPCLYLLADAYFNGNTCQIRTRLKETHDNESDK